MHKIIIHHSAKVIKFGIWIAGFLILFVALVATFPVLIKAPIEVGLSELSGLDVESSVPHFSFKQGKLSLRINTLRAFTAGSLTHRPKAGLSPVASIDNLRWDINLNLLWADIYHPNKIFVKTLVFYSQHNGFDIERIQQLVLLSNSGLFDFFKVLSIDKTLIKGDQELEIEPILLVRHKRQLLLKVMGQDIAFDPSNMSENKVDIAVTLPLGHYNNNMFSLPIVISNEELLIEAKIKLFHQKGDDFVEFEAYVAEVKANNLSKYLPVQLLGDDVYAWIKRGFIAGTLQDLKLNVKENLTTVSDTEIQISAQATALELLFDSDWNPLQQLNASFAFDGKKITVIAHDGKLNNVDLKAIKVQIKDVGQQDAKVEITGKVNSQSELLIEFLKRSPLGESVHKVLNQINLSGKADGNLALVIPLGEESSIIDIDLTIQNNRLSVLKGAIVVENYNSKLAFHHNEVTGKGTGNIRNLPVDIRVNPSNRHDSKTRIFGVELMNSGLKAYIVKRPDESWHGVIDSKSVTGNVIVTLDKEDMPHVQLSDIRVTTLDAIKGDWNITPQDFPDMYLKTKDIYVDDSVLPDFKVKLTAKDKLLVIDNLQFKGIEVDDKILNFQGSWDGSKTQLYAKAKGKSLAEFLQKLKVKEKITGGKFNFDISLACECAPWNMNYQDITGYFDMNVKEGVFTDKDPNIGRILSLLNIKSIVKRLQLNLSDVTNKGFAYENITAKIHLQNAIAKIEKFDLEASSSSIVLTGEGNIVDKQYNLVAKVTPAINDAVPIAAYLTGGGLVALGVWLVDEALFDGELVGAIVNGAAEFEYKITGSWDNPIIEKL
ncbi:FIG006388: Possible exported protein [Bathymodiolus thermophilus thioautotrophic gill symbiont]|uniref:YhdP family protein n=1 Tax=Bathymodiolus thermophilus thioautotrophic gill symbiont TaxID=2360 RepID=UPI00192A6D4C|nr:DUF3971 domain-containing protein [Bathymodiolus thermophilus thioautotrophic gill symbiont]CAB5494645.1 FIG006388: Possible exported protein [Bathymodiolus thermophilus thioautotrophic gill symbiont]